MTGRYRPIRRADQTMGEALQSWGGQVSEATLTRLKRGLWIRTNVSQNLGTHCSREPVPWRSEEETVDDHGGDSGSGSSQVTLVTYRLLAPGRFLLEHGGGGLCGRRRSTG